MSGCNIFGGLSISAFCLILCMPELNMTAIAVASQGPNSELFLLFSCANNCIFAELTHYLTKKEDLVLT